MMNINDLKNIVIARENRVYLIAGGALLAGILIWYFWKRKGNGGIISQAQKYVGTKEIGNNAGFSNPELTADLKDLSKWNKGEPYCMAFAKMVYLKNYQKNEKVYNACKKVLNNSTVGTYNAVSKDKSGIFETSQTPQAGDICIWKNPGSYTGHAAIVKQVLNDDEIITLEGNTSQNKQQGVWEQKRKYKHNFGMSLMGFIRVKA